ncbi:MAG TPA: VOC family protein [Acetobacteraceae bacterium]|jgi:hypothetical protein
MVLPIPTLDHVVVNVRDRMDEAFALYGRLGFTLTPRGYHTLGSINHLAMFGTDYLELIGAPACLTERTDILGWPEGLNGLVWGTEDAAALHATLAAAGIPAQPPGRFSRPVALPDGVSRDAAFGTVRLPNDTTSAGWLYFCQHFTRDLVWRDEWRRHANGAIGVEAALIGAARPERLGNLFRRMFGAEAVLPIEGGLRLAVGLARFDILRPDFLARRLGPAAPDAAGREEYMAALALRSTKLDAASIRVDGVINDAARLLVPAAQTMGVALEFTPA